MADISQIKIGSTNYQIKDSVARSSIEALAKGGTHFIGLAKGYSDGRGVTKSLSNETVFTTTSYKLVPTSTGSLIRDNTDTLKYLMTGDIVSIKDSGTSSEGKEFIFVQTAEQTKGVGTWYELGANLGAFAYANEGKVTFTPGGVNQSSQVTLRGGKTADCPIGKIERQKLVTNNIPRIGNGSINNMIDGETLDLSDIFGSSNDVYFATGALDDEDDHGGTIVYNIYKLDEDENNNSIKVNLNNLIAASNNYQDDTISVATELPSSGTAAAQAFSGNPAIITVTPSAS